MGTLICLLCCDNLAVAPDIITRMDKIEESLSVLTADFNLQTFDIWTESGRSATEQADFKDALIKFYKRKSIFTNQIRCMASGVYQNKDLVIASHIWKQCKHGVDSKNARNGLLLLRDYEV